MAAAQRAMAARPNWLHRTFDPFVMVLYELLTALAVSEGFFWLGKTDPRYLGKRIHR